MKKLFIFLTMLVLGIVSSWAALSSNTIAKSGVVTDTWNITSALPTDNWTAMGNNTPAGVTALGSYTAYSRTQNLTLSADGALFISFEYSSGNHQLEILGVDLLNQSDEVVRSHYHYGKTGTYRSNNNYFLDHITSGNYKIRFIINSGVASSVGNITIKHLNIKTANSFADISHWYFVRMNTNETHYMYYNSGATTNVAFSNTKANHDKYLWGFVKDTEGVKIYNKAAGSSVAIDNANPCKLSASGQTFTIATGTAGSNGAAAEAYFALYKNISYKNDAKSYLNYNSAGIKRHTEADAGSTFMIDEASIAGGKIYKIKAYFSDATGLYFTNSNGTLEFNTSATNGVKDYWILRSSGNADYPWKFESGRGDGMFLSNNSAKEGVTNIGVYLQINNCGSIASNFHFRGSKDGDAKTTGIVNLATWDGSTNSGFGAYGTGSCWSSSGHNVSDWTTDYLVEEVTGVDFYTVVSNINAGGVTKADYSGKKDQTNGGYYILASTPSASDFTAISVENYTAGDVTVDASAKTITVNYTANITYTLTDANGATYSWSASGTYGTAPTITGCAGSTISNEVWSEGSRTYTADITFPFPISSNSVTNWTYIGSFASLNRTSQYTWHVESSESENVITQSNVLPTNETGEIEKWEWSIIPACTNGAFTFTIKNAATNKYITFSSTKHDHNVGSVTLTDTGTALNYVTNGSYSGCAWKNATESYYLSINSYQPDPADKIQYLGQWSSSHYGTAVGFIEPTDFSTLMANLKTAYTSFNQYILPFNSGTYTETVEGKMMETFATYNLTTTNVIKDNPTAYLTASDFQEYTNAYNTAINGLQASIDENTFIRIRSMMSSDLINTPTYLSSEDKIIGGYHNCMFTQDNKKLTGKETIFYYDSDKHIIAFSNGNWLFDDAGYAEWNTKINHNKLNAEFDNVNIKFLHNSTNKYVYTKSDANGIYLDTDGSINSHEHNFLIEPVTSLPVTFNKAALGYATFFTPVELKIPENTHAYVCKLNGNKLTFFEITNVLDHDDEKAIPANTAVLLYNSTIKENANDEVVVNFPITLCDYVIAENSFHETLAAEAFDPDDQNTDTYSLRTYTENEATKIGFFKKTTGTYLAGFKAWLQTPHQASGARNLTIYFDGEGDPTGIVEALGLQNENVDIYDLNGRKLSSYKKGINIVNGKKVMVQ